MIAAEHSHHIHVADIQDLITTDFKVAVAIADKRCGIGRSGLSRLGRSDEHKGRGGEQKRAQECEHISPWVEVGHWGIGPDSSKRKG